MATPVEQVRLLIADVSTDPAKQILTDPQVEGYLEIEDGNVKLAAASALDAIASSEVLVAKVIRTQDLATDGAKVADALRKHAASLRAQVEKAAADAAAEDAFVFDIVDVEDEPEWPERTALPVWGL